MQRPLERIKPGNVQPQKGGLPHSLPNTDTGPGPQSKGTHLYVHFSTA